MEKACLLPLVSIVCLSPLATQRSLTSSTKDDEKAENGDTVHYTDQEIAVIRQVLANLQRDGAAAVRKYGRVIDVENNDLGKKRRYQKKILRRAPGDIFMDVSHFVIYFFIAHVFLRSLLPLTIVSSLSPALLFFSIIINISINIFNT